MIRNKYRAYTLVVFEVLYGQVHKLSDFVRQYILRKKSDNLGTTPEMNFHTQGKDEENQALSSISSDEVFEDKQKSKNQIKEIVSNRLTLRIMLTGVILYISNSVCYFGLTQNASGLPGNLYVNNILNCIAEGLGKGFDFS